MNQRMIRVLTCLGMVSVLLLTGFVTNVYAAETSDLGVPSSVEFHVTKIKFTLSGFPGQTGESVTNVGLRCSPLTVARNVCIGVDNIVIPGIGGVNVSVIGIQHSHLISAFIYGAIALGLDSLAVLVAVAAAAFWGDGGMLPDTFNGDIINGIISGNGAVTHTIYIPGIGSGQATVQLS
jgi:hypothetical protein